MQAIREREKRRFIILLDFHFSFGTYLPMWRMKHKIKESKTQQKKKKNIYIYIYIYIYIDISFLKYKWGCEGRRRKKAL